MIPEFCIKESFFFLFFSLFLIFGCSNKTLLWNRLEVVPVVELGAVDLTCLHEPDDAHWGMPLVDCLP